MTPGRRAVLLAGLALLLGTLAASDVSGREAALKRSLEPLVGVVVARAEIKAGAQITSAQVSVRRVPSRFAPAVALDDPQAIVGARATVTIAAGSDVTPAWRNWAGADPDLRPGERIVDVLAAGSARLVVPGAHVTFSLRRSAAGRRWRLKTQRS